MRYQHLPMFGCTLICDGVQLDAEFLRLRMRQAASDEWVSIVINASNPLADKLARPGACFALVELASQPGGA